MKKAFLVLLLVLASVALGGAIMFKYLNWQPSEEPETISSDVLLEQIQRVYKVVLVEGEFSDVLNYKKKWRYYGMDIPGFSKKAIVKVKGKVSIGYDMEGLKIEMDDATKTMKVYNLPEAEILAIDHNVSYLDMEEGVFVDFSEDELTRLNKAAKDSIEHAALRSTMFDTAEDQMSEMFTMTVLLAEKYGWTVEFVDKNKSPIELPTTKHPIEQATKPTKPKPKNPALEIDNLELQEQID